MEMERKFFSQDQGRFGHFGVMSHADRRLQIPLLYMGFAIGRP